MNGDVIEGGAVVAIFVAKDSDEFTRYKRRSGFSPIYPNKGEELGQQKTNSDSLSMDGQELPPQWGDHQGEHDRGLVEDEIGIKWEFSSNFVVKVYNGDKVGKKGVVFEKPDLDRFFSLLCDKSERDGKTIYIFVHWGNGGDRRNVARIERIVAKNKPEWVESVRALSSRRNDIFPVEVEEDQAIQIPVSIKALQELSRALQKEQDDILPPPAEREIIKQRVQALNWEDLLAKLKDGGLHFLLIPLWASERVEIAIEVLCEYAKSLAGEEQGSASLIGSVCQDWHTGIVSGTPLQFGVPVLPVFIRDVFLTDARASNAERELLKHIPTEFVFNYGEGEKRESKDPEKDFLCDLVKRLEVWKTDTTIRGHGIPLTELKDWLSVLFRKYCFQDEQVHGSHSLMDLRELESVSELSSDIKARVTEFFKRWLEGPSSLDGASFNRRFIEEPRSGQDEQSLFGQDELGYAYHVISGLYSDELSRIRACVLRARAEWEKLNELSSQTCAEICSCFRMSSQTRGILVPSTGNGKHEIIGEGVGGCIVATSGSGVRYNAISKQYNILLIDDHVDEVDKLEKALAELSGLFSITGEGLDGSVTVVHPKVIDERLHESLRSYDRQGQTFDLVLLDLCIGDTGDGDLLGYHLIKTIKQHLPQTPVVVYSQFDDMGHVVRALAGGADWFLKKTPAEMRKLARHMASLLSKPEWRKEWRTICDGRDNVESMFTPEDASSKSWRLFKEKFSDERKYLTYKCLEGFPGRVIQIKPMGGGFSTAATFQAVKIPSESSDPLQTPLIVKIDAAYNTRLEYGRYSRFICPYIANHSGRIENPERVLDEKNSAIVYTFAGKQDGFHELVKMKSLLERDIKNRSSCIYDNYKAAFDVIYDEVLPRIHAVKPDRIHTGSPNGEYGDDALSEFPNRAFDEIYICNEGTTDVDAFLANYLCRMPFGKRISSEDFRIVSQEYAKGKESCACYEFHAKHSSDSGCSIDVYDRKDKTLLSLTGGLIDHVAWYREHAYPGMSLWLERRVPSRPADAIQTERSPSLEEDVRASEFVLDAKIGKCLQEVYKDANEVSESVESVVAFNWFAKIVFDLLQEKLVGGLPTSGCFKELGPVFESALVGLSDRKRSAFAAEIELFKIVRDELLASAACKEKLMDVPAGIVHGDLNYANIMLESRKDDPKFNDAWFIDFARARRDFIMHDFGVAFTATLALLFDKDVWAKSVSVAHHLAFTIPPSLRERTASMTAETSYRNIMNLVFRDFIEKAVFDKLDAVPDGVEEDRRYSFVFNILRRIRRAALREGVSREAYALSVALACMVASRIYLVYEKNAPASAGMIAAAFICLARLKRWQVEIEKGRPC